jgi:hypothetical protein
MLMVSYARSVKYRSGHLGHDTGFDSVTALSQSLLIVSLGEDSNARRASQHSVSDTHVAKSQKKRNLRSFDLSHIVLSGMVEKTRKHNDG